MKLDLEIELSFSLDEESETDLFLFVRSGFNQNEVDFVGLTYEQVLEESFKMATSDEERAALKAKLRRAMEKFLAALDDFGKGENDSLGDKL